MSSKNAFLEDYNRKIRALQIRFPHYRILKDLLELEDALKTATWGRIEAATAFHRTPKRFTELGIRERIPCIYVNGEIRSRYQSHFEKLPVSVRTGKLLYDPLDLADWFMRNAKLEVESVVVPLTMLSDEPERLIQAFLAEKAQRLPLELRSSLRNFESQNEYGYKPCIKRRFQNAETLQSRNQKNSS